MFNAKRWYFDNTEGITQNAKRATSIHSYNSRGATGDCLPTFKTGHATEKLNRVRLGACLHICWASDKSCQGMNKCLIDVCGFTCIYLEVYM